MLVFSVVSWVIISRLLYYDCDIYLIHVNKEEI